MGRTKEVDAIDKKKLAMAKARDLIGEISGTKPPDNFWTASEFAVAHNMGENKARKMLNMLLEEGKLTAVMCSSGKSGGVKKFYGMKEK